MEKINIAELLKDCPKGMELDCALYENLYFDYVREHAIYPIVCYTVDNKGEKNSISFNWYGKHTPVDTAKCVIFPKGKTTWEGFVPPCKFKEGDVLTTDLVHFIFKSQDNRDCYMHCYYAVVSNNFSTSDTATVDSMYVHPATKEQRYILFQKMKEAGYEWNAETKTLEKIVNMKDKEINNFNVLPGLYKCVHRMFDGTPDGKLLFEVGNIYKCLSKHDRAEFEVSYGHSIFLEDPVVCKHFIPFETQGEQKSNPCEKCNHPMLNCYNFPCIKKKTFDQGKSALEAIREERVDNANKIEPKFKVEDVIQYEPMMVRGIDCTTFSEQDGWELSPDKFDISTLKPFDKVLIRDSDKDMWCASIFSHTWKDKYFCIDTWHNQCIPYEANKKLLGTTNNPAEYGSE